MADDKLIEAIAVALSNEQGRTTFLKMARAALDALKAEGWMLVRWEREPSGDMQLSCANILPHSLAMIDGKAYQLVGLEPPAAALVGRKP